MYLMYLKNSYIFARRKPLKHSIISKNIVCIHIEHKKIFTQKEITLSLQHEYNKQ